MISQIIKEEKLKGKSLCLHSSFKEIRKVTPTPELFIQQLLGENLTLLVPTFSIMANAALPPQKDQPQQNGWDYSLQSLRFPLQKKPYNREGTELDPDMGAINQAVLKWPSRLRGDHPTCSFSALGPQAESLITEQSPLNAYGPLKKLTELGGKILLAGVDLAALTFIHLAEELSGRRLFIRWGFNSKGEIIRCLSGGCSTGFNRLMDFNKGEGIKIFPPKKGVPWTLLDPALLLPYWTDLLKKNPELTQCHRVNCLECKDGLLGGPTSRNDDSY